MLKSNTVRRYNGERRAIEAVAIVAAWTWRGRCVVDMVDVAWVDVAGRCVVDMVGC